MATYGHTFTSGDTVTPTKLNNARTVTDIVNADIKSDAAIAGSKIAPSFNAPAVVAVNNSSDALRITQEGSGNAILVEDSANPDSTPLVVNNLGQIISGATTAFQPTAGLQITADSNDSPNATLIVQRCQNESGNASIVLQRAAGTNASKVGLTAANTSIGSLVFSGYDGTDNQQVARITCQTDGACGAGDMPGRLQFMTTADGTSTVTERMRITSAGNVGIATTTPTAKLHVSGDAIVSANTSTDALRITQEGSGNAILVEDSTNPDSTPLVVNNLGQIISGATTAFNETAGLQITSDASSAPNANVVVRRCENSGSATFSIRRSRGSAASQSAVQSGDLVGSYRFEAFDGANYVATARIASGVDGAPGANDMPGYLDFLTTPDGSSSPEIRARIDSAGNVGIGTVSPSTKLEVNGTVTATAFAGPITGNVTGNVTGNLTGTASAIADGSVSTAKIVDGAVTNAKIASGVDASKLTTGTLPADRIGSSAITTARINDGAVTAAKLDGAQTGSAPIYGCRAWVNFDGTRNATDTGASTNGANVLIRASGNVSSVLKNGTGDYTITFTTAMPDANYAAMLSGGSQTATQGRGFMEQHDSVLRSTTQLRVYSLTDTTSAVADSKVYSVAIFR